MLRAHALPIWEEEVNPYASDSRLEAPLAVARREHVLTP